MLPYAYYLIKVIICSAILTGYYWFFLRNKNFHGYNRFYLLASVVLSLLLPLIKIDFWSEPKETGVISVLQTVYYSDEYMDNVIISSAQHSWSMAQLYPVLYLTVSLVMLFVFMQGIYLIIRLLKKYPSQKIDSISFINTEAKGTPFSFLRYIFWNDNIDINTTTGNQIFKHEVAHVQEKHTHDKLFMNIILIIFWCNPIFWFVRKELNMIHEFIADKKAVEDSDTSAFAAMILQATYPQHRFQLANNFFYSPIKRRLLMLTKNKNPRVSYIGRILVLPLALLVFAAFTFKAKKAPDPLTKNYTLYAVRSLAEAKSVLQNELDVARADYYKAIDTAPKRTLTEIQLEREKAITTEKAALSEITIDKEVKAQPLCIVDGKEASNEEMQKLQTTSLGTINVLKGESATAIYGEKGMNGVILITTKAHDEAVNVVNGKLITNNKLALTTIDDRTLYVGVDNPINIGTFLDPEDVVVNISQGSMIGKNGRYIVRVTTPGDATISIKKKDGQIVDNYKYQVRLLPDGKTPADMEKEIVVQGRQINVAPSRTPALMLTRSDAIFSKVEVPASFPGGKDEWKKFLMKNLNAIVPVDEGWNAGIYTVTVQFVVRADGSVSDVKTTNYQGTKTAQECIRLIMNGPKWLPAMQNGKPVNSYLKQTITFVVEEQKEAAKKVTIANPVFNWVLAQKAGC